MEAGARRSRIVVVSQSSRTHIVALIQPKPAGTHPVVDVVNASHQLLDCCRSVVDGDADILGCCRRTDADGCRAVRPRDK